MSHLADSRGVEGLPFRIANLLRDSDDALEQIAPPFALVEWHELEGIRLYTDGLGMARLYQANKNGLWACSNRPAALAAIGAADFEEDYEAWSAFAACGWFTDMRTPIAGVHRLGPSTALRATPSVVRQRTTAALSSWLTVTPRTRDYEAAASAMVHYVQDASRLMSQRIVGMLSGGRDSRVVSAALIASGVEAKFVTWGPLAGEIETAKLLIELAAKESAHQIQEPTPPGDRQELVARIRSLHSLFDGDITPVKMNSPVAGRATKAITFGGAGGEIAHANYYPSLSRLEQLQSGGRRAAARRLQRYFRSAPGATHESYSRVDALVEKWITIAEDFGVHGPSTLDFFYLMERFRRWAPVANVPGSCPVFAVPDFVRAAFQLSPEERVQGDLHTALLDLLLPAWARVPFYKASVKDSEIKSARRLRIWQGRDSASMCDILDAAGAWSDVFDVDVIRDLWRKASGDGLPNRMEAIFQRVAWRATFHEHLAALRRRSMA